MMFCNLLSGELPGNLPKRAAAVRLAVEKAVVQLGDIEGFSTRRSVPQFLFQRAFPVEIGGRAIQFNRRK